MILVIDNYDSFTFNVVQALECATKEEIKVVRNDEASVEELAALQPSKLIVSPGPGNPTSAGISIEAIKYFAGKIPILGICLGHQAIGEAFGAKIVGAKFIKHGIVEEIDLDGRGIFRTIGKSAKFTRYHSLVIDESTLPTEFEVTARAKDGDIIYLGNGLYSIKDSIIVNKSIGIVGGILLDNIDALKFSKADLILSKFWSINSSTEIS